MELLYFHYSVICNQLHSLTFSDNSHFSSFKGELAAGTSFSQKFSNLKLCWRLLTEYSSSQTNGMFENLSERKPDFASIAQGNTHELMSICCLFLVLYFSIKQDEFIEKVLLLSNENQLVLFSALNEHCGIDLLVQESEPVDKQIGGTGLLVDDQSPFIDIPEEENEKCDSGTKIIELTKELQLLASEKQTLIRQLKEQRLEIEELHSRHPDSFDTSSVLVESLKQEIAQLHERLASNEKIVASKETESKLLAKKLASSENSLHSLNEEKEKELLKMQEKLAKVENENDLLSKQCSHVGDLKRQMKNLQSQNLLLEERLGQTLKSSTIPSKVENETLFDTDSELEKTQMEENLELKKIQTENQELKALLTSYEERFSLYSRSNSQSPIAERDTFYLEHEIEQLKSENSKLKERIKQLEMENNPVLPATSSTDPGLKFAIESLQEVIEEKTQEIARLNEKFQHYQESVKREQKLIMSAWYDVGVQAQKKSFFPTNSPSPLSKTIKNSPSVSWLQTQRNNVDCLLLNSK